MADAIKIGVSACLIGEMVRYDGGHKLCQYIADMPGASFRLVPLCPEVGCGLPVPRETMQLEGDPASPRLVTTATRVDLTGRMREFCERTMAELEREALCGFIFKARSPSCGLRVEICRQEGEPAGYGSGLFARAVTGRFPLLPVEEECGLEDASLRESFLERVLAFHNCRLACAPAGPAD